MIQPTLVLAGPVLEQQSLLCWGSSTGRCHHGGEMGALQ